VAVSVGQILRSGGDELGIRLSSEQCARLERYISLVVSWRSRLNLTGAGTPEGATRVLVLDALPCIAYLPPRGTIVDLGTGAGTPGVPIAVACPEARVILVEASRRKAGFLEVVLRELGLGNADLLHTRAEVLGHEAAHRERHDGVTARALAQLPVLAELALPLLRIGGVAVFPKGSDAEAEAAHAAYAVDVLGGAVEVRASPRPAGSRLVIVRKVASTPDGYPRRPGVPSRRPLVER
jgi:16S rRNA (guanine527-N7)-methyltransferase